MRLPTLCLAMFLGLSACSVVEAQKSTRGNRIDPDDLKELVVGTSTRSDAASLLGSPTARAAFDDNTWIYIHEITRPRIGRTPGVLQQDVVVLAFDDAGVLRNIRKLGQDDAQPVSVVSRTTPSPGSEASFLQQLLGNIGKFSPTGGGGSTSSGTSATQ